MSQEIENVEKEYSVLLEKWAPVLDYDKKGFTPIQDERKRKVMARLLENMSAKTYSPRALLENVVPTTTSGHADGNLPNNPNARGPVPMLMSIARRAMPNIIGFDVCGVQPLTAPVQLIVALQARYNNPEGAEALFNEANSAFSGAGAQAGDELPISPDGGVTPAPSFTYGTGMNTFAGEKLGANGEAAWKEMSMGLKSFTVETKTRALKTRWSHEFAEDLQKVHSLDARSELISIATTEITQDINREIIRTTYSVAVIGAQDTNTPGVFDINVDSDGRHKGEKIKGLLYQMQKEATQINYATRLGHGNFAIVSGRVYDALVMAGVLDQSGLALGAGLLLQVDLSKNIFAGTVNSGRMKIYVDPFVPYGHDYVVVGYKGESIYDAGLFYCPYSPLQMYEVLGSESMQPSIGFKTRYALASSPFALVSGAISGELTANANVYYRKFLVYGLDSVVAGSV